jgi:hypothetical protein
MVEMSMKSKALKFKPQYFNNNNKKPFALGYYLTGPVCFLTKLTEKFNIFHLKQSPRDKI